MMEVETIFDSDREEYEFMQEKKQQPMKEQIEELIRENESLAKTVNEASELIRKLRSKVKKSKSDVATEIFEEIETCMKDFEDDDDGYILKKCEFEFFMRELKKKYPEESK